MRSPPSKNNWSLRCRGELQQRRVAGQVASRSNEATRWFHLAALRRRILEASVRAPETWHQDAIRDAYTSGDKEWMLTAVFSMCRVRGFDDQILAALHSADPEIHYEAVQAAGNWELDAAWSHIVELVNDADTPKPLLLAAIGAVASIRPAEAREILADLSDSDDEEIAEAAEEAVVMAEVASAELEDPEDEWIH
jgi:hypothetical protein